MSISRKTMVPIRAQLFLSEILFLLMWPVRVVVAFWLSFMLATFICVVVLAWFAPEIVVQFGNEFASASPAQISQFTRSIAVTWLSLFFIWIGISMFVTGRLPWLRRYSSSDQPPIIGIADQKPHTGDN